MATSKRKLSVVSDIVVVSDYCVVVSGVYNCNNQAAKKCVVLLCVCVSPYVHCTAGSGCGVAVWWCVQCGVVGGLVVSSSV